MTRSCQIVSAPNAYVIGIVARRSARATSPAMRMRLRRMRSTHAPAGSAKRTKGRKPQTKSSEKTNGRACRATAATIGIASCETCEPSSLIDCPVQSFRKSAFAQRPPVGRRSLRIGHPPEQGRDQAEGLSLRIVRVHEVALELLEPAREAACVDVVQAHAQDGEGRPVVVVKREHLLGCGPEGSRRDIPDV